VKYETSLDQQKYFKMRAITHYDDNLLFLWEAGINVGYYEQRSQHLYFSGYRAVMKELTKLE